MDETDKKRVRQLKEVGCSTCGRKCRSTRTPPQCLNCAPRIGSLCQSEGPGMATDKRIAQLAARAEIEEELFQVNDTGSWFQLLFDAREKKNEASQAVPGRVLVHKDHYTGARRQAIGGD